jgi:hypothetical protein
VTGRSVSTCMRPLVVSIKMDMQVIIHIILGLGNQTAFKMGSIFGVL